MAKALALVLLLAALTGCAGGPPALDRAAPVAPEAPVASAPESKLTDAGGGPPLAPPDVPDTKRDIVKTATVTITAADPPVTADRAAEIATTAGGRVDNRSEDAGSGTGRAHVSLTLRVPAAKLDAALADLKKLGTVESVQITSDDVTAQRVDLDARITALQTSVDRLLGIMRDAKDPEALIKAEEALSQRQADLDSLRAQRAALGAQIDYSTVNVEIRAERVGGPAPEQYHGFFGQVERGWDLLMSALWQTLLAVGLLLPWLAAVAVAGGIGYAIVRLVRSRRS
ncbi:DUF4349 domain-containing protein [Mycolicibacterium cosmeticum]|uniref:DUF4349 domain-containing protein n=1 Tax=Mycolicibacterium cosmeticum TaxID=258533 RepID=W9AQX2_MYCCO|nr:DUF4349 domain-containing protein [Mycolicibacterium cosmeticum]TLH80644.1 DUF4349 domain-containing protein [Mycolicibacterium cosmeticum]CDO07898.1 hypothetical protein BN977_02714 [Mycolicibacterium cosmeticum]